LTQPDDAPPFSFDQSRFDALYDNAQKSFSDWSSVANKSLETALDINNQISAFYERLLLFDTGIAGVSVSALLSFGSRSGVLGHTKYFVVVLVSLGWASLLLSMTLCRSIMMYIIGANKKLHRTWLHEAVSLIGSFIGANTARLGTAIKGTVTVEGEQVDLAEKINQLSQSTVAEFEKMKSAILADTTGEVDPSKIKTEGGRAIKYTQLAILLLGVSAIILLCRL
jgi:hypothetical protein